MLGQRRCWRRGDAGAEGILGQRRCWNRGDAGAGNILGQAARTEEMLNEGRDRSKGCIEDRRDCETERTLG